MSKEPQTSVSDQVGERTASGGCSDFHIRHMAGVWYPQNQSRITRVWTMSVFVPHTLSVLMAIFQCTWISAHKHVSILDFIGAQDDGGAEW